MQSEKGKLIIHTGLVPENPVQERQSVRWRSVRHPLQRRRFGKKPEKPEILGIAWEGKRAARQKPERLQEEFDRAQATLLCAAPAKQVEPEEKIPSKEQERAAENKRERLLRKRVRAAMRSGKPRARARAKMSFSERLLRNSAVACALMLGILAVRNLDVPWARAAMGGIEQALTMRIDLDESLGKLTFVRALMPESVLVFFDLSNQSVYERPVDGTLTQVYSQERPWLEFECPEGSEVKAAEAGEVLVVAELTNGDWGVMIDHGEGKETVYAYLSEPEIAVGDQVERGQRLGALSGEQAYFEARENGEPCDPTELLGF